MQQPGDKQIGFEERALAQRRRPNDVLEKIDALVDLSEAESRLEAAYSELGRPGHRPAVLLRVMLLQHLYDLIGRPRCNWATAWLPKVRWAAQWRSRAR